MMAPDAAARNLRETKVGEEGAQGEEDGARGARGSKQPAAALASDDAAGGGAHTMASPVVQRLNELSVAAFGSLVARMGSVSALDSFEHQ